ncbi:MAG: hypothetical protein AB7P03_05805 [Kofleriaceae bacterium]
MGLLSRRVAALGPGDFHAAVRWVHGLPYGRNTDRADYTLVLAERRGTCSTKHALLAALARDAQLDVRLRAGVFLMSDANTPGVTAALRAHGLSRVPEAHTFLAAGNARLDVTFPGSDGTCSLAFECERDLAPEDIGAVKLGWHRAFIDRWARTEGVDPRKAWAAREACIAALGSRT